MFQNSQNDSYLLGGKLLWGFDTDLFKCVDSCFSLVVSKLVNVWYVLFLDIVQKVHSFISTNHLFLIYIFHQKLYERNSNICPKFMSN